MTHSTSNVRVFQRLTRSQQLTPFPFPTQAVARLLLERGAATEHASNNGFTALYAASYYGHEAVVRLLLERGAAIEHAINGGCTSLYIASCQT